MMKNIVVITLFFVSMFSAPKSFAGGAFHSTMFEETAVGKAYELADFHFEVVESAIQIGAYLKVYYQGEFLAIQSTVALEGNYTAHKYKKYIQDLQVQYPSAKVLFKTEKQYKKKMPEVTKFIILTD